jgi:hypothetical protein
MRKANLNIRPAMCAYMPLTDACNTKRICERNLEACFNPLKNYNKWQLLY